jgi:hypothetical protein
MKSRTITSKFEQKFKSPDLKLDYSVSSKRDHKMYDIYYKGIKIGIFQISHGSSEFGKGLIGKMARQLGINSHQLLGIEKCYFWAKDFIANSKLITKS